MGYKAMVIEAIKTKVPQLHKELQAEGDLEAFAQNLSDEMSAEIDSLSLSIAKKNGYDQAKGREQLSILNGAAGLARERVFAEMLEFPQE